MNNMQYAGFKNHETWSVFRHINRGRLYYQGVLFMHSYNGNTPYMDFIIIMGLINEETDDGVMWNSDLLDYELLNEEMESRRLQYEYIEYTRVMDFT